MKLKALLVPPNVVGRRAGPQSRHHAHCGGVASGAASYFFTFFCQRLAQLLAMFGECGKLKFLMVLGSE